MVEVVEDLIIELEEAEEIVEEAEAGGDVEELVEAHLEAIEAAEELIETHLAEVAELIGEGDDEAEADDDEVEE